MKHTPRHLLTLLVALFVACLSTAATPWLAYAQSEATASPSAELREIIRQRIEETIQEKRDVGPQYIGTLGTVTKVSTGTFSIMDTLGLERTVEISADTVLLVDGDPAELSDISINSGAVVMGTALDDIIIGARRVLIRDEDFSENREVLLGTVTEIDTTSIAITGRGTSETFTLDLRTTTSYEDSLGTSITRQNVEENQSVLLVTDLDEDDDDEDRFVSRLRLLVPIESPETDDE